MSAMRARKRQRLMVMILLLAALFGSAFLVILGLGKDSFSLFLQPSELTARIGDGRLTAGDRVRLGGMVAENSVDRRGVETLFTVTDCAADIRVRYVGILPDLFKEGQGVVTEGVWDAATDGVFTAQSVLAKHDENYAPPGMMPENMGACSHPDDPDSYTDTDEDIAASVYTAPPSDADATATATATLDIPGVPKK